MFTKRSLVYGLMVIVALSLMTSHKPSIAAEPQIIRIGFLAPLTGSWSAGGMDQRDAWILHIDEVGNKVAGKKIQLIVEDSEGKPDVIMVKIRKLVEKDKVHILAGVYSSGEAYAIRNYVHNQKVPLMIVMAGADDLTQQKRSPYIFRASHSNSQCNLVFGQWVYNKLGKRKLVIMGQDYPGSWEWCGSMAYSFILAGGKVLQELYSPLGTTDFAPYVTAINREADVVYTFFTGHEAVRVQKQYREYGLYDKIQKTSGIGMIDDDVYPQCGDDAVGTIGAGIHGSPNDPAYKAYRESFKRKFGRLPTGYSDAAYMGAMFILRSLQKVNGNVEDKEEFLKALKNIKIPNSGWGPISFDEYQNVVRDIIIQKLVKVGGTFEINHIDSIPQVSQFWRYTPADYLKKVPSWAQMKGKWSEYKPGE